jgi:hypothetical protein
MSCDEIVTGGVGMVGRRPALIVIETRVGTPSQQQIENGAVTVLGGGHERC